MYFNNITLRFKGIRNFYFSYFWIQQLKNRFQIILYKIALNENSFDIYDGVHDFSISIDTHIYVCRVIVMISLVRSQE